MRPRDKYDVAAAKIGWTLGIAFVSLLVYQMEQIQEVFVREAASSAIQNVPMTSSDPGTQMILYLGMDYYRMLVMSPSAIIEMFIIVVCFYAIIFIWRAELLRFSEKLNAMRITFDKEKKDDPYE